MQPLGIGFFIKGIGWNDYDPEKAINKLKNGSVLGTRKFTVGCFAAENGSSAVSEGQEPNDVWECPIFLQHEPISLPEPGTDEREKIQKNRIEKTLGAIQ